ncbi:hypothetical protein JBL43_18885 [Aureibaculum sp. A20]|uniref:Uncharacterized protein n=1 Tax=Aureibaculum flavum TaxID=2795986 RepID=A0ABS0WWF0_9FLAO|nr:hypothetical protein [Aureibaculum flavum]MBJ2176325.1 hypothetical protein [Aureibaculum flavum]
MKIETILKSKRNLIVMAIGILVFSASMQSQVTRDHRNKGGDDPFTRLKAEAKRTKTEKSNMKSVKITVNDPNWKGETKSKIKFVPFKLEDDKGRAISSGKRIVLKNGKAATAQEVINELNEIEKKLNAKGYSLRNKTSPIISKTVTSSAYLDGKRKMVPRSKGVLKKGTVLKNYMSLEKKVKIESSTSGGRTKTITLKPFSMYTEREKIEVNKYNYLTESGTIKAKKQKGARRFINIKPKQIGNLSPISEYKPSDKRANWNFGNPKTFQASIEGTLHRYAKIYPFDPKNPEKNKSEFNVSATGKVKGTLRENSMDILNASCGFYVPSNESKKMRANMQVKILGTTIFNKSTLHSQQASFSKVHAKSFDNSFEIEVPIVAGIDFVGLVGIRGEVGFEYNGEIHRTVAMVKGKPIVNLEGYGKAGIEFLKVFGGGVEGTLSFIKGELELQAYSGIFNQNSEQIVVGINHYFGYDINILKGSLNAYAEVCVPEFVPIYGGDCKRYKHNLFDWDGFSSSGTVDQGSATYTLANIAKYDEELVIIGN